jgi:hypothetical protein
MKLAQLLAHRAALAAPGVLGLSVFIVLSKPLSGAPGPEGGTAETPSLCSGWHRGDGQSQPFDLSRTERGYRDFKESMSQTLSKSLREAAAKAAPTGYDAGFAACRRRGKRKVTPSNPVPEQFRGKRFWFFAFAPGSRPRVPEEVQGDPDLIPLVTRVEKVEDLAKLSGLIGRAASLAPKGLGEALGVRCVPALVSISKEGEVVIDDDP